jgi:hypothetical protein
MILVREDMIPTLMAAVGNLILRKIIKGKLMAKTIKVHLMDILIFTLFQRCGNGLERICLLDRWSVAALRAMNGKSLFTADAKG